MKTLNIEICTICGIKAKPVIDESMKSVYGTIITGLVKFTEPIMIEVKGEKWWAYAYDNKKS